MDYCVVLVTVSSECEAKTIARALVEERLAACVNIIPGLTSIYRWEEKNHRGQGTPSRHQDPGAEGGSAARTHRALA